MITPTIFARLFATRPAAVLSAGGTIRHNLLPALAAAVWVIFGLLSMPAAHATATPLGDFWIADGKVYTTALRTENLYVGGEFSYIGPNTGAGTQVDTTTAEPSAFPRLVGQVHAAAPDGNGGWYVGGSFTVDAGGTPRINLVHIVPAAAGGQFKVDAGFAPDINSGADVTALVLSSDGSTLYVGGSFTTFAANTASPVTRNNIAALDSGTGAVASAWNPDANGKVDIMVLSGDGATLYVGGAFNTASGSPSIGGVDRNYIAALNADATTAGAAAAAWNPDADGEVKALALSGDGATLYAGGAFNTGARSPSIGGADRNHVAALDAHVSTAGAAVAAWGIDAGDDVNALILSADDKFVYLGGRFTAVDGNVRQRLARVRVDTTPAVLDDAWTPKADGEVYALELLPNNLVVGGGFTAVSGQKRHHIAEVNINTAVIGIWNPSAQAAVRVVRIADPVNGKGLFVGGDFISVGGKPRNNLAALNTTSFQPLAWDPNVHGIVHTVVPTGSGIFIGGTFDAIGGAARNNFGAVDTSGQPLANWAMNVNGTVNTLAVKGPTLYAGGAFTVVGTASRQGLAAFDIQGAALTDWAPQVGGGDIRSIALSNDDPPVLYAGGSFTSINSTARSRLAALDTKTAALTSWAPAMTGNAVTAVALSTDSPPVLYAGGDFATVSPACSNLAAITTGASPAASCLSNPDAPVHALSLAPDNVLLYLGGEFTTVAGAPHAAVAALTVNDGNVTGWTPAPGPGAANTVRSLGLASDHGTLYMGGDFGTISGLPRAGLAVFQPPQSQASPTAGPYNSAQTVTLTCADKTGASCADRIKYSTDGSVPTTAYATGDTIAINTTTTLRFYATDSENMREVINTLSYVIDKIAPTVSVSPKGGTYTDIQNVTLACTDSGGAGCSNIYYTTDGSVPTTGSSKYTGAIPLSNNTVLKFFAEDAAGNRSTTYSESYTIDATAPTTTPSPAQGTYTTPQQVSLACDDGPGFGCAATYYTLDGSVPNTSSPRYSQPIAISSNTTLNYFSVDKAGHQESPATAVYLIQTGTVVTSGGGLFCPPRYLLGAWLLLLGRIAYLRRRGAS